MKKLISLCMCIVLCIGVLPINAIAEGKENEVAVVPEITTEVLAEDLKTLGLFKGVSDTDFALERKPTRTEALVMLIRVLGQEQTALDGTWEHPFTDVASWADAYVGYAYSTGLTNGVSATEFGSSNIAPDYMYLTFVLRALGYSDANGDFTWNDPYALASDTGILPKEYDRNNFLRGDVVNISYAALNALMKNSQKTLANTLIEKNAFTAEKFSSVYRLGAVKLDIDPFTEIRKMIKQYGEYDEKNDTYSFVVFEDIRTDEYWENYVNKITFSYAESDGSVTLRNDVITHSVSYDGGTRSENKGTDYYFIRMTEGSETYEVEAYEKTYFPASGHGWEYEGAGVLYPEKWTGNYSDDPYWEDGMKHYHGWMDYTFTKRVYPWVGFVDSFAWSISYLIHSLDDEMGKYGLTNGREEFGFTVVIAPPTILSEMLYESTISDKEIDRLRRYDMTTLDRYTSYSEAKYEDLLTQYSMQMDYPGRTGDFQNFQEAHDYLTTVFYDRTHFKSVVLGLDGYSESFDVYINLLMAEAEARLSYESDNLEINFLTDDELVYYPDNSAYGVYTIVRGICEINIKNHTTTEWTTEDFTALKKTFEYSPYYEYMDFGYLAANSKLPQYIDMDVHLSSQKVIDLYDTSRKKAHGIIDIQILDYSGWEILKQTKVTAHGAENGQLRIAGAKTSIEKSEIKYGEAPASAVFYLSDAPKVYCWPDPGYWISDLIINGESVGERLYYPLDLTGEDITVEAVFEKIEDPVTITLTVLGDAPVIRIYVGELCLKSHPYKDKSVEVIVPRGTEIRVNIYSSLVGRLGHHITDVTMNGEVYETQENYIVVVNEDLTISANSKQN